MPELLFPVKNKKDNEDYQVAACFDQLDREAVNIIYTGIERVAVNSKTELAFDSVAASSQKTSYPSEYMEERSADCEHVVHNIRMSELRKPAGDV